MNQKNLSRIPMNRNTIQRRIIAIANDIEDQMLTEVRSSPVGHAFTSDGSTDVDHKEQLIAFVRFVTFFSFFFLQKNMHFVVCLSVCANVKLRKKYDHCSKIYVICPQNSIPKLWTTFLTGSGCKKHIRAIGKWLRVTRVSSFGRGGSGGKTFSGNFLNFPGNFPPNTL